MKRLILLCTLSLGILVSQGIFGSTPAVAGDPEIGKMIWEEQPCYTCHGMDGNPVFPGVPSFKRGERLDKPDNELMLSVMNGTAFMPAFKGIVSNADILDLLTFVRTLQD